MTRDDVIAALERMIRWNERDSDGSRTDAALLRALLDSLREARALLREAYNELIVDPEQDDATRAVGEALVERIRAYLEMHK